MISINKVPITTYEPDAICTFSLSLSLYSKFLNTIYLTTAFLANLSICLLTRFRSFIFNVILKKRSKYTILLFLFHLLFIPFFIFTYFLVDWLGFNIQFISPIAYKLFFFFYSNCSKIYTLQINIMPLCIWYKDLTIPYFPFSCTILYATDINLLLCIL